MTARSHGILLIDKPRGVTSHDVVAWSRRVFDQREAGHAGTLDPMATGMLVVLLGEGTKLSSYLTAESKSYEATVRFGTATDSLDADGTVVASTDAPLPTRDAIERALAAMVGPIDQIPPAVSAIKVSGVAMHKLARRGEHVELPPRPVVLESASVRDVREGECDIAITCSKGFYVRSLARDLADALGTLGHLTALRRTTSGPFGLDEAFDGSRLRAAAKERDEEARAAAHRALLTLAAAGRALPVRVVNDDEALALSQGKRLAVDDPDGFALATRDDDRDHPVCIAEVRDRVLRSARGFAWPGRTDAVPEP